MTGIFRIYYHFEFSFYKSTDRCYHVWYAIAQSDAHWSLQLTKTNPVKCKFCKVQSNNKQYDPKLIVYCPGLNSSWETRWPSIAGKKLKSKKTRRADENYIIRGWRMVPIASIDHHSTQESGPSQADSKRRQLSKPLHTPIVNSVN